MLKLFNSNLSLQNMNLAILLARVGISVLMLVHGIPKLLKLLSPEPIEFTSVFGMSEAMSLGMAVFSEVVCSLFILVGLGTRLVSIPLIITMLVAVFIIHGDDPFSKQEMGLHYLLVYIILLICGSGKYSLDNVLNKRNTK